MLKFLSLGSGSSGNCYYLETGGEAILVDLGMGIRRFKKYFADYGLSYARLKAIFVTHDHADHVQSVGRLSEHLNLPVYALEDTHMGISRNRYVGKKIPGALKRFVTTGEPVILGQFSLTPFAVPHDSAANCGYLIEAGGVTLCLATDIGHATADIKAHISRARYVVVEANYDDNMLEMGPYPVYLKNRIRGERGHLDNKATAEMLSEALAEDARRVWLCHLSEENNRPEVARQTVVDRLKAAFGSNRPLPIVEPLARLRPTGPFELE
ncbi:MAG: MBL fold metallo-hydrolase [Alloprevotella sp.]